MTNTLIIIFTLIIMAAYSLLLLLVVRPKIFTFDIFDRKGNFIETVQAFSLREVCKYADKTYSIPTFIRRRV